MPDPPAPRAGPLQGRRTRDTRSRDRTGRRRRTAATGTELRRPAGCPPHAIPDPWRWPVLYTDPVPILRMIMGRHIAGGVDVGIGAAQSGIDSDPAIGQLETGRVGEGDVRCSAYADQYGVRRYGMTAFDQNR